MIQQLYPDVRLVFGLMDECHWCDKFKKETLPMIKALGIRYQIIRNENHLDKYEALEYGFPFIAICDKKGYPLHKHGGHQNLSEVLEDINKVYDKHFPEKNKNVKG